MPHRSPQRTQARAALHDELIRDLTHNDTPPDANTSGTPSVVKLSTFMRSASQLFLQSVVVSRALAGQTP
eukprot:m.678567 g.678567  ORF g.678567 m.678567 type:complete len:70 (+) comp22805_c0_seq1:1001-1210(+)